jgi:hypothetical protein
VLIREAARRTGEGWPAIVLLAAAFGVYQAGLVDQSLFNQAYLDDTEFAGLVDRASTQVPGLGFSAATALDYVGNHIALSICAPIAVIESFMPAHARREQWLGTRGLAAVGVLFLLGSLLIFSDAGGRKGFLAEPGQLALAAALVLVLIGAALLPRRRRPRHPRAGRVPHPLWVGAVTLGVGATADLLPGWRGLGIRAAAILLAASLIMLWARRDGWGQRQVLAAWAGCLVFAAAGAYTVPTYQPASPAQALSSDIAISLITLSLLAGAFCRLRTAPDPAQAEPIRPGRSAAPQS